MADSKVNSFLLTEPLGHLMGKYAVPCVISLVVAALYNIVDQIFIANASYLGSYGNAANTVVFPMTVVALGFAVMIGDGCCAFVSICMGKGRSEDAGGSVGNAIVLSLISGFALLVLYFAFCEPILTLFGAHVNEKTYFNAREYFFWITVGLPFYVFGQTVNPIIRSDGSPGFAMFATVSGALLNIILDPIFIFPLALGMKGAAWATVIGQIFTAFLSVIYLFKMKAVKLFCHSFVLNPHLMKHFLPLGLTSFLAQLSLVVSMAAVQNVCAKYGAQDEVFSRPDLAQIPLSVLGIVMKFFQIAISITIGIAAGCIPIVGYNIGAGRKDRAKGLFTRLLLCEAVVGFIALVIVECFPKTLMGFFGAANESREYVDFGIKCFRTYLCLMVLSTVNKGAFIYLQALGKAFESTFISLLREVVFGVALALLLPIFFGLNGLLYSFPASDALTFIIATFIILRTYKWLSSPEVQIT